jgi:uncharacterized membrane protein
VASLLEWLGIVILSVAPVSELRGAIPAGIALGMDPALLFAVAVTFNALAFVPVFYGLEFFYGYFSKYEWVRKLVEKAGGRERGIIQKYGTIGLIAFVAVPLPVTGAWTGTLIAWLFHLDFKKAWVTVAAGVLISGTIVMALTLLGVEMISFL